LKLGAREAVPGESEVTAHLGDHILWPGQAEGRLSVRAGMGAILLKRLKAALLVIVVVAAALLVGILLAKTGHSLFNEERTPPSRGKG
jgi:hypothetical protein